MFGPPYWGLVVGAVYISGVPCEEPNEVLPMGNTEVDQTGSRHGLCFIWFLLPLLGHQQVLCEAPLEYWFLRAVIAPYHKQET